MSGSRTKGFGRAGAVVAATLVFTALCFGVFAQTGGGSAFTDSRDGQKYRTAKIGKQVWMAENLNFKTDSSWCYGDDESNCQKYGRLYDWNAAMRTCPAGWHLPSKVEWDNLIGSVGGEKVAGKGLKSKTGWSNWTCTQELKEAFNRDGRDCIVGRANGGNGTSKDFSAFPGGIRSADGGGGFGGIGDMGCWWNSTENESGKARVLSMYGASDDLEGSHGKKEYGFSVRCVKE